MPQINILPKEIYQLIAAGEVVERPSSIVKEMVENCIDAGAKNITIEIRNGGTTYIRITDDGCGIERSEIKKVFVSHATSKITSKDDLTSIGTLGFRGEAMASISAVSKVELLTKSANEDVGTRYEIAGGEEISLDDAGCPNGTTIVVRDIFFNTPARMKFLKKDVTEGNSVAGVVDRMAISHPEISFRFIREGKQTLITSGNGDLKSAIYSVFGREVSEGMIPVDYSYEGMRVTGFTSKPISSRKSRAMQFFFINSRLVKSATAMAALEQAYKNTIMVGKFPMCVLNIELNPAQVDVNVHPAKIEVRFANERPIFELIYYGVKTAVECDYSVKEAELSPSIEEIYAKEHKVQKPNPSLFKKKEEPPVQQSFKVQPNESFWSVASPKAEYRTADNKPNDSYKSGRLDLSSKRNEDKPSSPANISSAPVTRANEEQKAELLKTNAPDELAKKAQPVEDKKPAQTVVIADETEKEAIPNFKIVGEAFKTYIIIEIDNELYFIDKHAAHERMNYEQFKAAATVETQMLLSPQAVNLTKDELDIVIDNLDLLQQCGFEVEQFGDRSVIVRAVPSLVVGSDIEDLILEIAQKLLEHKTDILPDKIDWIYHSASCRGAVKGGDYTTPQERELFVKKLLSMPDIRFCPHGRPVFIKLSKYEIEKQFGRV